MDRSRQDQMWSQLKQANLSTSSLEGMERPLPVRSFNSFIKTVPPNPSPTRSNNKPLPQVPSLSRASPSPPRPTRPNPPPRSSSDGSWKAPVEWFGGGDGKDSLQSPSIPLSREYSPLLPEPSPDLTERLMELRASQGASTCKKEPRLNPIYECAGSDLAPPGSPPRSPLPTPPRASAQADDKESTVSDRAAHSLLSAGYTDVHSGSRMISPARSAASQSTKASTKEKAFASLGVVSPKEQASLLQQSVANSNTSKAQQNVSNEQQCIRGKKLLALNKGNPLTDDSWEDSDMGAKTRHLSFSQDYHDLLADQYQEMSVRPGELLQQEDVPRPLSWRRSSSTSSPQSTSRTKDEELNTEGSSGSGNRHRFSTLVSWVPRRMSVGPVRTAPKSHPKSQTETSTNSDLTGPGTKTKRIPDTQVDEELEKDLRFLRFLPSSKTFRLGKKAHKQKSGGVKSRASPTISRSTVPLVRLPGGLAIVKSSAPAVSRSIPTPSLERSPTASHQHNSAKAPSLERLDRTDSPTLSHSDHQLSFDNPDNRTSTPRTPMQGNTYRMSESSTYSQHSTSSSTHPVSKEVSQSPSSTSPRSVSSWRRLSGGLDDGWSRPRFLEKARDARERHNREARQKKLKDSIKVLGPTDPAIVTSYLRPEGRQGELGKFERVPGYMVSGRL